MNGAAVIPSDDRATRPCLAIVIQPATVAAFPDQDFRPTTK